MNDLNALLATSLNRYFTVLTKKGYESQENVNSLIVLCIINHILNMYSEYITEEDLRILISTLYCIGGNCLIDFPSIYSEDSIFHEVREDLVARITQNSDTRNSEDGLFRIET